MKQDNEHTLSAIISATQWHVLKNGAAITLAFAYEGPLQQDYKPGRVMTLQVEGSATSIDVLILDVELVKVKDNVTGGIRITLRADGPL